MAEVFSYLQQASHELMQMGTEESRRKARRKGRRSADISDPSRQQDIRLAHMCTDMKDAVKEQFEKMTLEKL